MSTQTRSSGGGRNNNKKANHNNNSGGGGGGNHNNNANNTASVDVAGTSSSSATNKSSSNLNSTDKDVANNKQQQQQQAQTKAAEYLLETLPVNAFEISSKKKKNKPANTDSGAGAGNNDDSNEDWDNNGNAGGDSRREKSRNRSSNRGGGGGGRGGNDSRGWRGREARENERNLAESNKFNDRDGQGGGYRGRGRGGYGGRGGYSGGRGGRGGRMGPRGGDRDRGGRSYSTRQHQDQHQEVDTWDNSYATNVEQPPQQSDEWGDWDNEEYVGSLKDTKVFTPSNMQTTASVVASSMGAGDIGAPPGLGDHQQTDDLLQQQSSQQYSQQVVSSNTVLNPSQFPEIHSANYFNSLTSQNTQSHLHQQQQAQVHAPVQYNPNTYGTVFGDPSAVSSQPRRARAKVPPPSKIPASAVEMPGDMLSNATYLEDVQFGFGIEESAAFVEALSDKFSAATSIVDNQQPNVQSLQQNQQTADLSGNDYQSKQQMPGGIQSNKIQDSLTSGYSQRAPSNVQSSTASINAAANAALEQLTKNDPYGQSNQSNAAGGYQSTYNPNVSSNKVPSYQPAGQAYQNNTSYNNSQSSTGSNYPPQPNSYNSYNQNSVNSYQQANSSVSGGNTGNSTQNIPVGGSGVNNSSSATANAGGYLSSQYQSNQTSSAFQSQYQNNQSVYGGSAGLSNNTGYSGSTSTSANQYTNFSSNSKLKESSTSSNSHFESVSNVSSSVVSSTVSSVSNAGASVTNSNNMNSSSAASSTLANNSSTSTTGGAGSSSVSSAAAVSSNSSKANQSASGSGSGVVQPNIQMVSQYIQAGLPYYQQPVYSYEDITIMQQRMPHVTQYFDVNYTPTSLGAAGVRDGNLGSVAYSPMTDGRFTRTDNNSSPVSNVSNTMSQQAGSSTPMINVPYAYFYGGNMMPGGFQYHGTPAIYPVTTNANGKSNIGRSIPKPSYNSGYGSATSYDSLSQATQDYSKGAYAGTGVNQQTKSQTVSNNPQGGSGSDIASSMYNKAHVALNKVNSYDKQAFHSATPPPFNLSGTQASGTGSTQYGMYIQPMPAAHHNMNMHQQIHQVS
uniref:Protein lingerer n=1 Tax=Megaselia scalaris TaxID=36166 RepID=T1GQQ5_MEGSC